jgi:hypothetical protein
VRTGLEAAIAAVGVLKLSVPLQTRVGIATGLVIVGDLMGSGEAQERGIIGESIGRRDEAQQLLAPVYDWFSESVCTENLNPGVAVMESA